MKIKWNEYTWYSKWTALIFLLVILPVFSFYIGVSYQKTTDLLDANSSNGTDQKKFSIDDVSNVYKDHYHFEEVHDGTTYVIRRFGDTSTDDWIDELWKYDQRGNGTRIFSAKGLDFRVSADQKYIAISAPEVGSPVNFSDIVLVDANGTIRKTFKASDLGINDANESDSLNQWSADDKLWLTAGFTAYPYAVLVIDPTTSVSQTYDIRELDTNVEEFDLNPNDRKVVYSDFPAIFDTVTGERILAEKKTYSLFVYDLMTKQKSLIATSTAKAFKPKWVDGSTVEFDSPTGQGRIRAQVR